MALSDNLVFAAYAQSGQSALVDEGGGGADIDTHAGTDSLEDLGGGVFAWQYAGGASSGDTTNGGVHGSSPLNPATVAFRIRVTARVASFSSLASVLGASNATGFQITNNSSATGNLLVRLLSNGSIITSTLRTYTNGDWATFVFRVADTAGADFDAFYDQASRVTNDPDYTFTVGDWATFTNAQTRPSFGASSSTVQVAGFAGWKRLLTDAECAAVADDFVGEISAMLAGSNTAPTESSAIGTVDAAVGVALSYDLEQHFTDADSDPLTITLNGGGTALPSWASISSNTLTGTPTSGDVGTTTGHVLDVTDGVNPAIQSTAFSITVSALPRITTAPVTSGASVLASTGGWTVEVYSKVDGELVLRLTGQATETDGTLIIDSASLIDSTQYTVVTTNTGTGEQGVRTYTAAVP